MSERDDSEAQPNEEPKAVIRSERLVFVEGDDELRLVLHLCHARQPEWRVFGSRLEHVLSATDHAQLMEGELDLQIVCAGGRGNLKNLSGLSVARGFRSVKHLTVVWDAETSLEGSFDEIVSELREGYMHAPDRPWERSGDDPSVAVAILPGGGQNGALETILVDYINAHHRETLDCVDSFVTCARVDDSRSAVRAQKRIVNAWLSVQRDPGLRAGAAFHPRSNLFDMNDPVFDPLADLIFR